MIYLLFVLIAAISVAGMCWFGAYKGVVDTGKKIKIYKPCEENVVPFTGKNLTLITIICFVMALAVQILLYFNTNIINFIKLYGLMLIVLSAALVDVKRKIIPNELILVGLGLRVIVYVYEFIALDNIKPILINDLIGFAIGFVFLGVVYLITKGSIGFGDVKLFGVIGITCGAMGTYSTLLVGLIISAIFSIVNIARKTMGRKDSFPFGPCIALGYVIVVLIGSY